LGRLSTSPLIMPNVTLYSFKTKQRTVIPLAELAPGWLKIRLVCETGERDEVVWVNPQEAKQSANVRHPPFDEARLKSIRNIQVAFRDVRPLTFEEWELGFRCDLVPDSEIALWRWMAYKFTRITSARRLTRSRKRDLLQLLLAWVNCRNVDEVVASLFPLPATPEAEAREFLKLLPALRLISLAARLKSSLRCWGWTHAGPKRWTLPAFDLWRSFVRPRL